MPDLTFRRRLNQLNPDPEGRRWLFVPYDQLTDQLGPLATEPPEELGIVLVESPWKASQRPYHQQKLGLVLANGRHFALEQAERGVAIRHVVADGPYRDALGPLADELGPLRCMDAAERELRADLAPLATSGALEILPHEGWVTTEDQFAASHRKGPPWRMDRFYRHVRKATGILMEDGSPVGGKLSFDADNRQTWKGSPKAPEVPTFDPDPITLEVCELVSTRFSEHPGTLDPTSLPATREDAASLWAWALDECLEQFGPFQDAMAQESSSLFHTRISALLHLHRLLPRDVIDDVLALDIPLASKEGFVRQILGWREFVRHVHRETDGFRSSPGDAPPTPEWDAPPADPQHLEADAQDLPEAFWGTASGLNCLDRVVEDVWREGYGHHITRLMVLANLATLLDVSPRQLTDWFWVAYTDAYDWVVEPNVLGMGTYAVGDLMTTKPYIAGSAYIHRMSDYCGDCAFKPTSNCPIRSLYWAYLDRHREALSGNNRLAIPLASSAKRKPQQRRADRAMFEHVRQTLADGEALTPEGLPAETAQK